MKAPALVLALLTMGLPLAAQPGPEEFTIESAIAHALRHNPRIAEAAAQVREYRGRVLQARATRLPQLGANTFVFRQGPPILGRGDSGDPFPAYRWNVGAFLSQVVFDWGQRTNRQRALQKDLQAAAERKLETEQDVRLVVSLAFYNVLRAEELLKVAVERREAAAEQLRVARAKFESDVAPRFDVIRAEAEVANAEQGVIEARNEIDLGHATFNTALGREVAAPVKLIPPAVAAPVEVEFARARAAALSNRPLLASLRSEVERSRLELRSRRMENRPQLDLNASYDRPNPGGFASLTYRYAVGLVLRWPFWDSGLTRGRVREAEGLAEGDRQELERVRQEVELEVRRAELDLREARKRIETAAVEQKSAREALRVADVRYRSGVGTTVEVTDAQVAVARAGQNLANAQFDYEAAAARLVAATGTPLGELAGPGEPAPGGDGGSR